MTKTLEKSMPLALPRGFTKRFGPPGLTFVAMVSILIVCGVIQPRIWSTAGLTLILSSVVPLVIAALAQMVMMSVGDIDLSIGMYVGLVSAVAATALREAPLFGVLVLAMAIGAYAALGALVESRKVPSLIATLGASFVWFGVGLLFLPTPGGLAPDWLTAYSLWRPPFFPVPVLAMVAITVVVWMLMQRTGFGALIRALGSNPAALARTGTSLVLTRASAYTIVGILGVVAGLALTAEIGGGDPSSAGGYTLVSIAAVILGGGSFRGGRAVAWGTLFGAATLGLLTVLLSLLNLSSNIQPAIQGGIVIAALAGRLVIQKLVNR